MIAKQITPGMSEDKAKEIARATLGELGMRRGWHHIIVRCGPNTTKDFMERSEPGVVLQENDIFFIDIGPIFDGCEGDAGDTMVVGHDPDMARAAVDVKILWQKVRARWLADGLTGRNLYAYATRAAQEMGWELNLELTGHRLSEFPHDAHYDGTLSDVGFRPTAGKWVLEIQIRHPEKEFGAFFEDLLIEDDENQSFSYARSA
jgi:Xaa-Pro aminopeptidase